MTASLQQPVDRRASREENLSQPVEPEEAGSWVGFSPNTHTLALSDNCAGVAESVERENNDTQHSLRGAKERRTEMAMHQVESSSEVTRNVQERVEIQVLETCGSESMATGRHSFMISSTSLNHSPIQPADDLNSGYSSESRGTTNSSFFEPHTFSNHPDNESPEARNQSECDFRDENCKQPTNSFSTSVTLTPSNQTTNSINDAPLSQELQDVEVMVGSTRVSNGEDIHNVESETQSIAFNANSCESCNSNFPAIATVQASLGSPPPSSLVSMSGYMPQTESASSEQLQDVPLPPASTSSRQALDPQAAASQWAGKLSPLMYAPPPYVAEPPTYAASATAAAVAAAHPAPATISDLYRAAPLAFEMPPPYDSAVARGESEPGARGGSARRGQRTRPRASASANKCSAPRCGCLMLLLLVTIASFEIINALASR